MGIGQATRPRRTDGRKSMLVVTRRLDETVHIGTDIVVRVLEIRRHRISLGSTAPEGMPVIRGEVEGGVWCDDHDDGSHQ